MFKMPGNVENGEGTLTVSHEHCMIVGRTHAFVMRDRGKLMVFVGLVRALTAASPGGTGGVKQAKRYYLGVPVYDITARFHCCPFAAVTISKKDKKLVLKLQHEVSAWYHVCVGNSRDEELISDMSSDEEFDDKPERAPAMQGASCVKMDVNVDWLLPPIHPIVTCEVSAKALVDLVGKLRSKHL
jgi:hypothetical protein